MNEWLDGMGCDVCMCMYVCTHARTYVRTYACIYVHGYVGMFKNFSDITETCRRVLLPRFWHSALRQQTQAHLN